MMELEYRKLAPSVCQISVMSVLILLGFISYFNEVGPGILIAYVVAAGFSSILFVNIKTVDVFTGGILLVFMVFFIMYFVRFPMLLANPSFVYSTQPPSMTYLLENGRNQLCYSLYVSVYAFAIFCSSIYLMKRQNSKDLHENAQYVSLDDKGLNFLFFGALFCIVLLMLFLGYLAFIYHVGVSSVSPGNPLPFRLKGLIFYSRLVLIPLSIVCFLCFSIKYNRRFYIYTSIALLVLHALSDIFIRSSRSSFLLVLLLLSFVKIITNIRINRAWVSVLIPCGVAVLYLEQVAYLFRFLRIHDSNSSNHTALFVRALIEQSTFPLQTLAHAIRAIYFRIPGIETIWSIQCMKVKPLGLEIFPILHDPFGVAGYLTFTVYSVPRNLFTLFVPGPIGWFYLVGGYPLIALGMICLAWCCVKLPEYFSGFSLQIAQLSNIFFLWFLFISFTDGNIDNNIFMLITGVATIVGLRWLLNHSNSILLTKE